MAADPGSMAGAEAGAVAGTRAVAETTPAERRRLRRWRLVQATLFRRSFHDWYGLRRRLLRRFGARLDDTVRIRPSVRIDRPWNLVMGRKSALGDGCRIWAEAPVRIGARTVVSQYATIATWRLEPGPGPERSVRRSVAPVTLGDDVWVAAESHVDAGSNVEDGSLVGARSVVRGTVPGWVIAAGDPLRVRGPRRLAGGASDAAAAPEPVAGATPGEGTR